MTSGPASAPSALVDYAVRGLRRCWMPETGRYCYRHRWDLAAEPNESLPDRDAFYTLNVLLGFSRVPQLAGKEHSDLRAIYQGSCREAGNPQFKPYAFGMALWAGAELDLAPPGAVVDRVAAMLASGRRAFRYLSAQDVGMLSTGATAMALGDSARWRPRADMLARQIQTHYHEPATGLFYNNNAGLRRSFSSFASQVYSLLALYRYGEAFDADWAISLANRAAQRLIALQGPRGEWGWFYYVPGGRVVDYYEVYSVHQHGMAPAFLHHAARHGVAGAREALIKGFLWLFGANEMGVSMLRPKEAMFYRSQRRVGDGESSWPRVRRSLVNAALGRSDRIDRHHGLKLRHECRSYELGWILWSFGGRADCPELTERAEFAA
jgi:hypothetical protein